MNFNTVPIKRPDVFESYISVMSDYLKRTHPEFDYEEIREWVADKVNRRVGVLIGNLERARNEGSDLTLPDSGMTNCGLLFVVFEALIAIIFTTELTYMVIISKFLIWICINSPNGILIKLSLLSE